MICFETDVFVRVVGKVELMFVILLLLTIFLFSSIMIIYLILFRIVYIV